MSKANWFGVGKGERDACREKNTCSPGDLKSINAKLSFLVTHFTPNGSGGIFFYIMYCLHEVALTLRLKKLGQVWRPIANNKPEKSTLYYSHYIITKSQINLRCTECRTTAGWGEVDTVFITSMLDSVSQMLNFSYEYVHHIIITISMLLFT